MVVLACVDTVRVYGFRPEALARGRNEVLVAHLVPVPALLIRDLYHHHLSVGGARLAGLPSHDDDQWSGGRKANVLRWNLATTLTL